MGEEEDITQIEQVLDDTNVPYERYCLYQSRDDGNGIKLGYFGYRIKLLEGRKGR